MRRRLLAAVLLAGVFVGFGSAAFSAVKHAGGASCHRGDAGWHHQKWHRHDHGPAAPDGGTIQP